jgi:hypothetical protein
MISNMYHVALLQLARHPLSYVLRAAPVYRMEFYIDRSTPDRLVHFPFFPVYIKDLHTAQNVPVHHDVRVWCLMSPSQPDGFHVLRQLQRAGSSNPRRSEPLLVTVVCRCSQCASRRGISLIVCAHSVRWQTKVAGKATHQVEFDQQHAGPIPAVVKVTAYLNCGEALALDPIQPVRVAVLAVRRHSCDLSVAVR